MTDPTVGFQRDAFASALRAVVETRGVSDRRVCREAGLSPSTAVRVINQGQMPSTESLVALADWAGLSLDAFVVRRRAIPETPSVLDQRRVAAAQQAARAASEALALVLTAGEAS